MKARRYRFWIGLNTGTALLLAAVVLLMINYLSFRHYHRDDISAAQRYTLSSKTTGLLDSLEHPLDITVFFQPGNVLYEDIHNLLREYSFHCGNLRIHWVDPDRDLAQTEELAVKYEVTEPNVVVFDCNGRNKYVRADEIASIDASSGIERITAFKGEQAFSSAIHAITQQSAPVVYFLTGHGEGDIENFDARTGFSGVARLIERDNANVRTLQLSSAKQVPDDCDALILAGASQPMSRPEVNLLRDWLRRSGRLMVLSDAGRSSGLEPLLLDWGVALREDIVLDPARTLAGSEVFVAAYTTHPITRKLDTTAAIFHRPRSVEPDYTGQTAASADRPQVTPLALSSDSSWSETQLDQMPARLDRKTDDLPGPVSMAVAVEKGNPAGRLDLQIRPARIVVFGDSGFVSNAGLTGGDISLFMSALNWLLDREELMAIPPKEPSDTRLKLTRDQLRILFWSTVAVIPAAAALFGGLIWLRRRK